MTSFVIPDNDPESRRWIPACAGMTRLNDHRPE